MFLFPLGSSNLCTLPSTHSLFSNLSFARAGSGSGALLGERDDGDTMGGDELDEEARLGHGGSMDVSASAKGGWLESDDIEDF